MRSESSTQLLAANPSDRSRPSGSSVSPALAAAVAFADRLPWPVFALDEAGIVVHATAAVATLGVNPADAPGQPLHRLIPEYAAIVAERNAGSDAAPTEAQVVREGPHGLVHERTWLVRAYGARFVVIVDETRLRELEAGDIQTARLASLGFLLAGVCHEVSNPLASIYSTVQILQEGRNVSPDMLEKGLANIATNVKRVLTISKKLTDFSRVDETERTTFKVDWAVEEALVLLHHHRLFGNTVVQHVRDPEAEVFGIPGQLQQVFYNLMANAVYAMGGEGELYIATERSATGTVAITIRDTGPGIAPEHLPRLFEPFFSTKPLGEGTGLGLAISNEIVHEHGGTIRAWNNPDRGATFLVQLPLREKWP